MVGYALSLALHILNVGHGCSVVVEFKRGCTRSFGLIDCNRVAGQPLKAAEKLRSLGADSLSFVCLTHPHADHYSGLKQILEQYEGAVGHFFCFPMGNIIHNRERLKKWGRALKTILLRTDDLDIRAGVEELLWIIRWGDKHSHLWAECDGDESRIAPIGFQGVEIHTVLPPKRVKGTYLNVIETQDPMALGTARENEVSLAITFGYRGKTVLIGGDGCAANWNWRKSHFERTSGLRLSAQAVNLPHHGSKADCSSEILRQMFDKDQSQPRFAISSADGQSHPSVEVIEDLERLGVKPYCTNLIPSCGATVSNMMPLGDDLDPELARWLREVSDRPRRVQSCQGDITLEINDRGDILVTPEFGRPCGYRGDYDNLLNLL